MRSSIEIFNIRTRQMRVVWQTPDLFEAPNCRRMDNICC